MEASVSRRQAHAAYQEYLEKASARRRDEKHLKALQQEAVEFGQSVEAAAFEMANLSIQELIDCDTAADQVSGWFDSRLWSACQVEIDLTHVSIGLHWRQPTVGFLLYPSIRADKLESVSIPWFRGFMQPKVGQSACCQGEKLGDCLPKPRTPHAPCASIYRATCSRRQRK